MIGECIRSVSASVYNLTLYNLEEKGKFSVIRNFYFNGAIHSKGKSYWKTVLMDISSLLQKTVHASVEGDHFYNDRYPVNSKSKWIVVGIDTTGYHSHQLRWCYEAEGIAKKIVKGKMNLRKFVEKIPTMYYDTEILHSMYPNRNEVNNYSCTISKLSNESSLAYLYKIVNFIDKATENAYDPIEVQVEIEQHSILS